MDETTTTRTDSPSFNRRRILVWGGTGALGVIGAYLALPSSRQGAPRPTVATPGMPAANAPAEPNEAILSAAAGHGDLQRERFLPYLNSDFQVSGTSSPCRLIEVGKPIDTPSHQGHFISYSLMFRAPLDAAFDSGTHRVSHAHLGEFDLFLSSVGHHDSLMHLEAVICQRV